MSVRISGVFSRHLLRGSNFEQCQVVVFIADDLGFWGPGSPDLMTELCPAPRHCLDAHQNDTKKAWRVPTEHLSRGRQSWARKTQNRNVQIRNLAVSGNWGLFLSRNLCVRWLCFEISWTVSKVLSDRKVLFKHKIGIKLAVNGR